MPSKDAYHDIVRIALEKDGWTITDDPLTLRLGRRSMFVDLGAERLLAAERDSEKIAVEVKSFLSPSPIHELETAWGQFFIYSRILQQQEPERCLYLAVSEAISQTVFNEEVGQLLLEEPGFHLLIFSPSRQEITRWIL